MKERVIILRTIKWSEADLMVHTLNGRGGRMNFIARSALKSRKRFGGGILEPTHYILANYKPSSARDDEAPLHHLNDAELIKGFDGLRDNFERLEAALAMVGLMEKVAQPGIEDSPEIFDLLGNALFAAEQSSRPAVLRIHFETKLLYLLGVLPPQTWTAEFLRRPLKEHMQIEIQESDLRRCQTEEKQLIQRYLQGLGSSSFDGVEI